MRYTKQLMLTVGLIFILPLVATTAATQPSGGFTPVTADFQPVTVPEAVAGNFAIDTAYLSTDPPSIMLDPVQPPKAPQTPSPRKQPAPERESVLKPTPKPKPATDSGGGGGTTRRAGRSVSGLASWYCRPGVSICTSGYPASGKYAAAGPSLRAAFGGESWRGKSVTVCAGGTCISGVRLIDWCQCYRNEPHEKVLDLYYSVFSRLPNNRVTVSW